MAEYLDQASWLPQAQALAEGKRLTVEHDCGGGKKLLVTHKKDGWDAWCYRCNLGGFVPHPPLSLVERIKRRTEQESAEAAVRASMRPPMPANFNPSTWPLEARVWLYKAGLSNETIQKHGFYFHERTQRVVMPVIEGKKLVYWQARGFNADYAKYINPEVDKDNLVAKFGAGNPLVLTEDMLSAVKVSALTEAWSLLGTNLPNPILQQIIARASPVLVWLDPDRAGVIGTTKALKKLRAYGVDAKAIRSERDPKLHTAKEIANLIGLDAPSGS